jgi:hypothetical protein
MVLSYDVPTGSLISLDSFPEQKHNPLTDHADFANLMPDALMRLAVNCINTGRTCDAGGPVGAAPGGGQSAAPGSGQSAAPAPTATRDQGGSASRGGVGHSDASPPGMRIGQQGPPPAATPPAPATVTPTGAAPPTPPAPGTDGREQTPPGPPDDAQRQSAEPPLPDLAGVAGAPADARNGSNASAFASEGRATSTAAGGTGRTLLYALNGLALAALLVWLVTVRRRRLR